MNKPGSHGRHASAGRPFPFPSAIILTALGAVLLAMTAGGCRSQAERSGVSSLPVNRPANWENRPGYVEGDL